jgi:hypothetical protein
MDLSQPLLSGACPVGICQSCFALPFYNRRIHEQDSLKGGDRHWTLAMRARQTDLLAHLMGTACSALEALALGYVDRTALAGPVLLL